MITIDDLSPGRDVPVPMEFTVTSVNWQAGKSRRAIVVLKDSKGGLIRFVDYEGAKLAVEWKENHQFRISRCSVQSGGQGFELQLAPSQRTRVEPLGPVEGTSQILIIGDTHVGRTHHPGTGEEIDPISAFQRAVSYGIERDVDAVAHVGDIFHETATSHQTARVAQDVLDPLTQTNIPFYYVKGNHSVDSGDDILAEREGSSTHLLGTEGARVGSETRLFGISHYPAGEIPWSDVTFPQSVTESVSILILHQTLKQISGPGQKSVDIERIQRQFPGRFDFVLSGHHHDAIRKDVRGVPVMYTGAVERMSVNEDSTDRVAWLLTTRGGSVSSQVYEIPSP